MSKPLYLTRLQARQFRSFRDLDIPLEAGAGVLIVQGSNGLGKSSLFHGVEWLLTDKIEHFRKAEHANRVGRYLCRWKKPTSEPASMSMTFSDGQSLTRSLAKRTSRRSELSGVENVADYLKRPDWVPQIRDLSQYLLLTHVLAQTSLSRFAHRDAGERFNILHDAARSEVEDLIARNLHGVGTTSPARAFTKVQNKLLDEIKTLAQALDLEARAWDESQISGAIDDDAAASLARRINDLLHQAGGARPGAARAVPAGETDPVALAVAVDQIGVALRRGATQLTEARRLRAVYAETGETLAAAKSALTAAGVQVDAFPGEEIRAQTIRAALTPRLQSAEGALAETAQQSARINDLKALVGRRPELAAQHSVAQDSVSDWNKRHKAAVWANRVAERRSGRVNGLDQELIALSVQGQAAERDLAAIRGALDTRVQLDRAMIELKLLETAGPDWETGVDRVQREIDVANAEIARLTPIVASLREAADAISAAVVAIVSHLPGDACACPVCDTTFRTPVEFRDRAQGAAARLAPELKRQQAALDSVLQRRADYLSDLIGRTAVYEAVMGAREVLETLEADWSLKLGGLTRLTAEDQSVHRLEQLAKEIETDLAALRPRTDLVRGRLAILTHDQVVNYTVAAAEAARGRDAALSGLYAAERALTDLERDMATADADIGRLAEALFGLRDIDDDAIARECDAAAVAATSAREHLDRVRQEIDAADFQLSQLMTRRAALEAERSLLAGRVQEVESERAVLSAQWAELQDLGPIDEPAGLTLSRSEMDHAQAQAAFDEAEIQLEALRTGRLAWSRQKGHAEALSQLRALVEAAVNAPRDDVRASAEIVLAKKRARRDTVIQAKGLAASASDSIASTLDAFNAENIRPLGRLMTRINQAILADPRIGIALNVKARKIHQASLKEGELPQDLGDIDPLLVHSEGQMAALAVSLLCAASLTFPWSRWKALVLDDPLQHNDAIHASAFADFIGNLVKAEDYQVLLSTHELAQAEFLERKFKSRGIPCTTVHLTGMGNHGVTGVIRGPEHLQATG